MEWEERQVGQEGQGRQQKLPQRGATCMETRNCEAFATRARVERDENGGVLLEPRPPSPPPLLCPPRLVPTSTRHALYVKHSPTSSGPGLAHYHCSSYYVATAHVRPLLCLLTRRRTLLRSCRCPEKISFFFVSRHHVVAQQRGRCGGAAGRPVLPNIFLFVLLLRVCRGRTRGAPRGAPCAKPDGGLAAAS